MVEISYIEEDLESELPAVELKAAEEAAYALLMAIRNYGLFPPGHASTKNMLGGLTKTINLFTKDYGELRLEIEKNRILYNSEKVYEEANHDDNPAFIFFRDGVRILEFLEGLEGREIVSFFTIVDHYKIITAEPDGDLVTDLWSADFPHINYEASDELWEAEPVLEFSLLNPDAQEHMSKRGGLMARGFNMLKSMLGIEDEPVEKKESVSADKGQAPEGERSAETGGPVDWTAAGDRDIAGELGVATDSLSGEEEGEGYSGEGFGEGAGEGFGEGEGDGSGGGGFYEPEPEPPVELDFWEALTGSLDVEEEDTSTETAPGSVSGKGGGAKKVGKEKRSSRIGKKKSKGPVGKGGGPGGHRTADAAARISRGRQDSNAPVETDYIGISIASVEPGHSLWDFSEEEQRTIENMVREYEEGCNNTDAIEFLMLIIREEEEPHVFESIINFMREEFRIILTEQNFRIAYVMLTNLRDFREEFKESRSWTTPVIDEFFEDIGEAEILEVLLPIWPELPTFDQNKLKAFAAVLQLLPAKAGESLATIFSKVESAQGRSIMADLIASFASRDRQVLEELLSRPEEELVLRLLKVLVAQPDEMVAERLLYKVIGHPKEQVRSRALDILVERESEYFEKLFQLTSDPSQEIRGKVFAYLEEFRSKVLERLFVDFMVTDRFQRQERDHIEACYKTLGKCGSDNSVEMLEKILFSQAWNFVAGLGTPVHRNGAAVALALIKSPASLKALNKAEKSAVPHIKKAWRKATGN